jgi:hypothetical protein
VRKITQPGEAEKTGMIWRLFANAGRRGSKLLLFGFIVTFGSAAMGSAIMAMDKREADDDEPRGGRRLVETARNMPIVSGG